MSIRLVQVSLRPDALFAGDVARVTLPGAGIKKITPGELRLQKGTSEFSDIFCTPIRAAGVHFFVFQRVALRTFFCFMLSL